VCVGVREREKECVRAGERERMCVFNLVNRCDDVCVREKERECVCVCVCVVLSL